MSTAIIILLGLGVFFGGAYLDHAYVSTFLTSMGGGMIGAAGAFWYRDRRR